MNSYGRFYARAPVPRRSAAATWLLPFVAAPQTAALPAAPAAGGAAAARLSAAAAEGASARGPAAREPSSSPPFAVERLPSQGSSASNPTTSAAAGQTGGRGGRDAAESARRAGQHRAAGRRARGAQRVRRRAAGLRATMRKLETRLLGASDAAVEEGAPETAEDEAAGWEHQVVLDRLLNLSAARLERLEGRDLSRPAVGKETCRGIRKVWMMEQDHA
eukprot:353273-Chlamydomonas_euryale.AAC.3